MKSMLVTLCVIAVSLCSIGLAQEMSERDQARMAVQAICPVSGQKLGESSVKVKVGEEIVFLCCRGCAQKKVNPQHWATIHANFAKAQRICPVMKHELPDNPKWTIVEGQIVYTCCAPCIKKVAADPKTFLQQVDDLYVASLKGRQRSR